MTHQPSKPLAVVVGFVVKLPLAGMSLFCLHYLRGLMELGYDVFYVERQNYPDQCYDPSTNGTTNLPTYGLDSLQRMAEQIGLPSDRYTFIDLDGTCHGADWPALRQILGRADFVMATADATWFDELGLCPNRIFIDGDPFFTQHGMRDHPEGVATSIRSYNHLFTYGARIGASDCLIPQTGDLWHVTRPVVATSLWDVRPAPPEGPITTVMNWRSGSEIVLDGRRFGYKGPEFLRFITLPNRTNRHVAVALGGADAPREEITRHGWELVDPLRATRDLESYQRFIEGSWADFGIAKQAYVASRSGWFSDRSTCYLASGRPVLHQDTGFTDWLQPAGGVLPFSDMTSLLDAVELLAKDYENHAFRARRIAEECFEASTVLDELLRSVDVR